jgi:hypothetical protein
MDYEAQIEEIMDWFDFRKVAETMKALKWEWLTEDGMQVPSESEIRQYARQQLKYVVRNKVRYTACGGFLARNDDGYLSLAFQVSEWQIEPKD